MIRAREHVLHCAPEIDLTFPGADMYRGYYRFLETDDECWDTAASHHRQGFWMVYSVFLPREVLRQRYLENARRLFNPPAR